MFCPCSGMGGQDMMQCLGLFHGWVGLDRSIVSASSGLRLIPVSSRARWRAHAKLVPGEFRICRHFHPRDQDELSQSFDFPHAPCGAQDFKSRPRRLANLVIIWLARMLCSPRSLVLLGIFRFFFVATDTVISTVPGEPILLGLDRIIPHSTATQLRRNEGSKLTGDRTRDLQTASRSEPLALTPFLSMDWS